MTRAPVFSWTATLQQSEGVDLTVDNQTAGTLSVAVYRPGNNGLDIPAPGIIDSIQNTDPKAVLQWRCKESSTTVTLDLYREMDGYVGKFTASGRGHALVRLTWQLPQGEAIFPFVPAFMYDHNAGGKSPRAKYPQLDTPANMDFAKPWQTQEWFIRADRSSHGLTSMIGPKITYAIGGRDVCKCVDGTVAEKNGLGISDSSTGRLSFSLGFANIPFTYCAVPGRNFFSRPEGFVNLDQGEVTCDCFLFVQQHENRSQAAGQLLRRSYAVFQEEVVPRGDIDDALTAVAEALVEFGYCKQARSYRSTFNVENCDKTLDSCFSSGWAGGAQVAYPLLLTGYRCDRSDWIDNAKTVLDNLAQNAINPQTHLFNDNYDLNRNEWNTRGWWYDALKNPGHCGYVNGQVCYYLLQSYLLEKEHGQAQNTWLNSATHVLDHVIEVATDEGGFGYTYREDNGKILDSVGFSGAWFIPALTCLYRITQQNKYLDAATQTMNFYRTDVEAFCVYAGPLDISKSPDSEGILAWIRGAHLLHQLTDDARFFKDLLMGLDYELSWKFAYNVVNEHEPLKSLNWCSKGGSVTSVNNPHIHPMSSAVLSSLHYAAKKPMTTTYTPVCATL